jgi:hypothetical protein
MSESGSGDLSPERRNFIATLSREEFYGKHPEYKLCVNSNNEFIYLLTDDIQNHSDCRILSEDEVLEYRAKINQQKLKEAPLTPGGLGLKQRIINELEFEDKKRKGLSYDGNDDPIDHRKWHHKVSFIILIPSILLLLLSYIFYQNRDIHGDAQIVSELKIDKVFLDGSEIVLSNDNMINGLTKGNHQLLFIMENGEKFVKNVNIFSDNMVKVEIKKQDLQKKIVKKSEFGYVKFNVEGESSYKSYIRDSLVSNERWVPLTLGNYVFRVEKQGYISEPSFRTFLINVGDSIRLPFGFRKIKVNEKIITGDIDVSASVNSAEIFINGKSSGYYTNHIFSNMPAGKYRITVKKDGYKLMDSPKDIEISEARRFVSMRFNLQNDATLIKIETKGQEGDIFLDGKAIGKGRVTINIDYGKHNVSFEKIENFYQPEDIIIDFKSKYTNDIVVRYYPIIEKSFFVSNNKSSEIETIFGYSQFNKFHKDSEHKPELVEKLGEKYYELKYPFAYNNPVAGHAFLHKFNLNNAFSYDQEVNLYLYLYYTDENFSLTSSLNPRVSIIVNNKRTLQNIKVLNSFKDGATKGVYQKIRINELLQNGKNELFIYSPELNNSVLMYKGFEIKK